MKTSVLAFLLIVTLPAPAEDMREYLTQTQTLVQQGQHQEALERMIWFHHHALKEDPSMYGVRLTLALDSWKRLAEFYPPAKTALVTIRDRDEARLAKRGGSRRIFHDYVAINQTLGEPERSLETFKVIHQEHPRQAAKYWDLVEDQALEELEFDLAKVYLTDVNKEFEETKKTYQRLAKFAAKRSNGGQAVLQQHQEDFVEKTRPLIQLAMVTGDSKTASEIQLSALDLIEEPSLRALLTDGLPKVPDTLPAAEDPAPPEP